MSFVVFWIGFVLTLFKFGFKHSFIVFEFFQDWINKTTVQINKIKCKTNANAISKKKAGINSGLCWKSMTQSPVEEDKEEQTQFPSLSLLMKQNGAIDVVIGFWQKVLRAKKSLFQISSLHKFWNFQIEWKEFSFFNWFINIERYSKHIPSMIDDFD